MHDIKMSDNTTDKGFGKSAECYKNDMNSETSGLRCNSSGDISAAVSDSGDEDVPIVRSKKRVQQFSDSDVDSGDEGLKEIPNVADASSDTASKLPNESYSELSEKTNATNSDDDVSDDDLNKSLQISRLRKVSTSSGGLDSNDGENVSTKSPCIGSDVQDSRIKSKRNKLRSKFESLVSKRLKEDKIYGSDSDSNSPADEINSDAYQSSADEASSVIRLKQKTKEKIFQMKSSICDPDTSDEEGSMARALTKPKRERKSVKPTSPKPIRMSAKQAMENMQKIKSESNRMLREKEVSLPYHRPKALSLKDILSKRRPAVSADGKTLPIKMNEEQLRQYAQQLEQRQKEVIELCKSESEDELDEPKESKATEIEKESTFEKGNLHDQEMENLNDTIYDDLSKTETIKDSKVEDNIKTNSDEQAVPENSTEKMDVDEEKIKPLQMDESQPKGDHVKSTSLDGNKNTTSIAEAETDNDNDRNNSADMELVYNDSVEASGVANNTDIETSNIRIEKSKNLDAANKIPKPNTEVDSQLISLKYDNTEKIGDSENLDLLEIETHEKTSKTVNNDVTSLNDDFSDDDVNMDDIDALIENAEITANQRNTAHNVNSPMLIKEHDLTAKPKLTGAPGMVIDLDGTDPLVPRKLTGVELLKERFVFFAKLKTPEELERENEKTLKPGALHLKLKQELEEQIAEQRSLEWAKRLQEEQQHKAHEYVKKVESDAEDIDDIEAKLEEKEHNGKESSSESEDDAIEYDIIDKPRKRNPMVDDEAEESDCDEVPEGEDVGDEANEQVQEEEGNEAGVEDNDDEDDTESSSDESEEEQENMPKKGRILKAFEDSDDEDKLVPNETANIEKTDPESKSKLLKDTQDDVIQLAQKSQSEDLFTSQDSKTTKSSKVDIENTQDGSCLEDKELGTQTFSILERTGEENVDIVPDKLPMTFDAQAFDDNLDAVVEMCSGSFSQNLVPPSQMNEVPASQVIGEDVLALCTGQFYDNQFVSQNNIENGEVLQTDKAETLTFDVAMSPKESFDANPEAIPVTINKDELVPTDSTSNYNENERNKKPVEDSNLKSILDELNDPEFDLPKPNKYFVSNMESKENNSSVANAQFKKKFVIDSDDDERTENVESSKNIKKKKKMKHRALQISDDEEEDEDDEFESEEVEEDEEQIVEYDSDENEVIVQPQNPKKKRKTGEFFENEAELTSEDEWIGSGDEDEAGLDRMEREAGDEDTFNQNQLQRELGQIHMRDVLDQDKREVRMIQELLFEDGDLGAGSRQRKFRWKDVGGEDETGSGADEFADTQEDEAESEEQWRKQRHEREMFLRSLNKEDEATENISFNRTSFIKANLSKNCSNISLEVNTSVEMTESPAPEKKTAKDIPSPKKPFGIFQQNYHGSLLARGQDALSRLAALATPLATDDDEASKGGSLAPTNKRNFVFAMVDTTKEDGPKVMKRKAESIVGTPRLVKRLRTEDKQKHAKASILDHLKA